MNVTGTFTKKSQNVPSPWTRKLISANQEDYATFIEVFATFVEVIVTFWVHSWIRHGRSGKFVWCNGVFNIRYDLKHTHTHDIKRYSHVSQYSNLIYHIVSNWGRHRHLVYVQGGRMHWLKSIPDTKIILPTSLGNKLSYMFPYYSIIPVTHAVDIDHFQNSNGASVNWHKIGNRWWRNVFQNSTKQ